MTSILIECAVKAANESNFSYRDSLRWIIKTVESTTGYQVGNQFTIEQITEEMSKYSWI